MTVTLEDSDEQFKTVNLVFSSFIRFSYNILTYL